jgi:hydrogenase expression/formation protein HypE
MSVREGLSFGTALLSDSASVVEPCQALLAVSGAVRCMRDPTRGGLSSCLNEIAAASGVGIRLLDSDIPIRGEVRAACEMLGLDPLYVANEGKVVAIVAPESADRALAAVRALPLGREAAIIGEVVAEHPGMVTMKTVIGGQRVVSMLAGEQLPRIC